MTKQWLSDFHHGRGGQSYIYDVPRTCINCGKDARPRLCYCSDACSDESRANVRAARLKPEGAPTL